MDDLKPTEDKDWKVECLSNDIKRVEMAKKETPDLYNQAVAMLKKEVGVIGSIEELKAKGKEVASMADDGAASAPDETDSEA